MMLDEVLKIVVPTEEEVRKAKIAEEELKRRLSGLEFALVGSYARNTWLSGNLEIDVFIFFQKGLPKAELEKRIMEIGKRVLDDLEIRYAEHPYVHGKVCGVEVDLVPCYKVESTAEIRSAVDRTPFHHEWLKERIKGKENEVRILKQFFKANGIYGAEYKVRGFSGYLCELLIVFYGSFLECVKNARFWKRNTMIDVAKGEVRKGETFFVVDPVDEKRNVAANLSIDNLAKFVMLCREFFERPSIEFFIPKKVYISKEELKKAMESRKTAIFAVEFERPDIFEDNLYSQLEKASRRIFELLKEKNFMPIRSAYLADEKCYLIFECEVKELSAVFKRIGPRFEDEENVKNFLAKHKSFNPFFENGRICTFDFRTNLKPEEYVADFIIRNANSLGKNVGEMLLKGFKIIKGEELLFEPLKDKISEMIGVRK